MDHLSERREVAPNPQLAHVHPEPIIIETLVLGQVLRLTALLNRFRAQLGLTEADLAEMKVTGPVIAALFGKLFDLAAAGVEVDLDHPGPEVGAPVPAGEGLIIARELGAVVGLSPSEFLLLTPAKLDEIVVACWEVNASGPLGRRLRPTIEALMPIALTLVEHMGTSFQVALMRDRLLGGTDVGGTITSSPPSTSAPAGPSTTP